MVAVRMKCGRSAKAAERSAEWSETMRYAAGTGMGRIRLWMALVWMGVAALALTPGVVRAQDLAKENEELKAKIAEVEAQRDGLAKRVSELNGEVTKLRTELAKVKKGGGGSSGGPGGGVVGGVGGGSGGDATASPDGLFGALKKEYEEKFGSMARQTRPDLMKYQREVAGWTRAAQREHRGPVEWTIRVVDPARANERPGVLVFVVVDPVSKAAISGEATALLPSRWVKDVATVGKDEALKVSAILSAQPIYNAQREEAGATDAPRFIGPYAEFGFELAITKIGAWK